MRFRFSSTAAAVVLAMALLPMKAGGCGGKTACIKATAAGTCPSAGDATTFFAADPCSGSQIQSVNGDGVLDGQFCCYPVTEFSNSSFSSLEEFPGNCCGCGGFGEGGFGGFGGGGFGGGGFGGFGGGGGFGAQGGFGGGPLCTTCSEQMNLAQDPNEFCPGSSDLWDALRACSCSFCSSECEFSTCPGGALTSMCEGCLTSFCPNEFDFCAGDF